MGRTVINETENKQTVILNDSPEGIEGGYFDSAEQWHEFGGGGGSAVIIPAITITFKNRTGQSAYGPSNDVIVNGVLTSQEQEAFAENGEDVVYTTVVPYIREFGAILRVGPDNTIVEDMVNCTLVEEDGDKSVKITNISEEASCTVTQPAGV